MRPIQPLLLLVISCASTPEAISLLGRPLQPLALDDATRTEREAKLAQAEAAWEAAPDSADALVWVGRRTAYLGRYQAAIERFTDGIQRHPQDPRFLRHRGHRLLTLRRFDAAIDDLERARELIHGRPDAIEPDGLPNARNQPTTTLHFNVHYHLGLAYYLAGDFWRALAAYRRCGAVAQTSDARVAAAYWHAMTARILDQQDEARLVLAAVDPDVQVIENHRYLELLRLYRGDLAATDLLEKIDGDSVDAATLLYGIGNWYALNGRRDEARRLWRKVVDGAHWPAFGFIAAEVELAGRGGS